MGEKLPLVDGERSIRRNIGKNSRLTEVNRESVVRVTRKKFFECFFRKLRALRATERCRAVKFLRWMCESFVKNG